jgi:hypothetical protein
MFFCFQISQTAQSERLCMCQCEIILSYPLPPSLLLLQGNESHLVTALDRMFDILNSHQPCTARMMSAQLTLLDPCSACINSLLLGRQISVKKGGGGAPSS